MIHTATPRWETRRTDETRMVEEALRQAGFEHADAYRYNPASIRVRVIDERFEGLTLEKRDAMVEPILDQLPEGTQSEIINLFTFAPSELQDTPRLTREFIQNVEFEEPSPSML